MLDLDMLSQRNQVGLGLSTEMCSSLEWLARFDSWASSYRNNRTTQLTLYLNYFPQILSMLLVYKILYENNSMMNKDQIYVQSYYPSNVILLMKFALLRS